MGQYSDQEREILDTWPTVTAADITRLNDLFPHYIFFRKITDKKETVFQFHTSCCGRVERLPQVRRTDTPKERALLDAMVHKQSYHCPWCGRRVTMIALSKAGHRKFLQVSENAVLLHARGDALYADALFLRKDYETEEELTAPPFRSVSSGYRFSPGEAIEVDHQMGVPWRISSECKKLGAIKKVQEPFKIGSLSWYQHQHYTIVNRDALENHPVFRYCGYFHNWQYRPFGARGYAHYFRDFISYLTAFSIYPRQVELLVKAEYWEPLHDLLDKRKKNATIMCWEEPDIVKSFGLPKSELKEILTRKPSMDLLAVRRYVQKHFKKNWTLDNCKKFMERFQMKGGKALHMEVLRFAKTQKLDIDKLLRYLELQKAALKLPYGDLFIMYQDYWEAAYLLGRCMEHSKVTYPERMDVAHMEATAALDAASGIASQSAAAKGSARKLKYEFELDGLRIIFPLTAASIKREGKLLSHCVGGYADRHIAGVLSILFLRYADRPGVPYVTIEMDGNRIRQVQGYRNGADGWTAPPRELHREFLATWTAWLKAGSPREKDGSPKLPKEKAAKRQIA